MLLSCSMQGFELMLLSLGDPSERVVNAVHQVFIPAFAAWTTELGTLQTALIPSLLARIEKLLTVSYSVWTFNTLGIAFVLGSELLWSAFHANRYFLPAARRTWSG